MKQHTHHGVACGFPRMLLGVLQNICKGLSIISSNVHQWLAQFINPPAGLCRQGHPSPETSNEGHNSYVCRTFNTVVSSLLQLSHFFLNDHAEQWLLSPATFCINSVSSLRRQTNNNMEGKQESAASAAAAMQQMGNTTQETANTTESGARWREGKFTVPSPPKKGATPMSALIRQVIDKAEQKKSAGGCNSPPPPLSAPANTPSPPTKPKRPPPLVPARNTAPLHEGSNSNGAGREEGDMISTSPTGRRQDMPKVNVPALKKPLMPPRAPGGNQKATVALTRVQSKSSGLALVDEGGDPAENSKAEGFRESHSTKKVREASVQPFPPNEVGSPSKHESVPKETFSPPSPPPQESKPIEQNGDSNEGGVGKNSPLGPLKRLRNRSSAMSLKHKPASLRLSSTSAESDTFEIPETPSTADDVMLSDDFVQVSLRDSEMEVGCVCVHLCVCVCTYMHLVSVGSTHTAPDLRLQHTCWHVPARSTNPLCTWLVLHTCIHIYIHVCVHSHG